ncbi:MAG: trehalose-6-phosphate synthase [Gammaproteobacteria bacterium]|nr:trehalose-6-phosphate synthase [Gammaproteobacteria bacterium]
MVLTHKPDGSLHFEPGSGGLVTALLPVLRDRGGVWAGWPGLTDDVANLDDLLQQATTRAGYRLRPVQLTDDEHRKFYYGFSNEVIWPLFHDLQSLCHFDPSYWQVYQSVNRKYAELIARETGSDDFIWVHDYHLMNVAVELRRLNVSAKMAFFLHIPFPAMDIFVKLPWRFQLLRALLEFDLIGFQTLRDRRNFVECVRALVKGAKVQGKGQVLGIKIGERTVRVGSFPVSIDFNGFVKRAAAQEVADKASELKALLPNRQLILGLDRLDYTKGIPYRLEAFRNALIRYPQLRERVTLIQVVVPSREDIPQYHDLKTEIERLVGEINGQFTRPGGWVPIHYIFRSLKRSDLLAYYRAAEIALVTPLKDGMNLVAKEYCTCSIEEDCVLVLSEFAGAAAQMQNGALLVNPYDVEGSADAIHRAFSMPKEERRTRMRRLRRAIRHQDIFWWVDSFLRAAIAKDLSAFPLPDDYVPHDESAYSFDLTKNLNL